MKKYRRTIILTTFLTGLPILIGLILWSKLPDSIATHWGANGQANGWSSKVYTVFWGPCILMIIHLFAVFLTLNDPKKTNIHKKPMILIFWIVPVISILMNGIIYLTALGIKVNISAAVSILMGVLFILLGNYLPKLRQNYTIGIKLPWTLCSEENWYRTHRLGGKLFIIGGILVALDGVAGIWLGDTIIFTIMIGILLICIVISVGYSFWLFKKGI
ncbi:MAG TPA: SdpI family protein [Candidatus Blautia merdigallinarum]|uniref:SdpI family protein n=1 Tax=Candidatus Blautia merdigallinarum TaxID=2838495 RepID=A0A9D2N6E2_9FIRM|nr:SdpI family protein [Candidatus Blautia merdigallinarum]